MLAVYLLSSTEAYQLLKLPLIFKHFSAHRSQDSNISFAAFLAMHYLHGSPHDEDYEEDMKLPFKTVDQCPVNVFNASIPPSVVIPVPPAIERGRLSIPILNESFIASAYLAAVWQPPRTC